MQHFKITLDDTSGILTNDDIMNHAHIVGDSIHKVVGRYVDDVEFIIDSENNIHLYTSKGAMERIKLVSSIDVLKTFLTTLYTEILDSGRPLIVWIDMIWEEMENDVK